MLHIDELTLMMHIDNELGPDEQAAVSLHLSTCKRCQETYEEMRADHHLLLSSFGYREELDKPISLHELTQVQIDAIAHLHKHNSQRTAAFHLRWIALITAGLLVYLLSVNNLFVEWLSANWSTWQSDVLWSSIFWLSGNAVSLLFSVNAYTLEITFLFTMLLGALVFLNARGKRKWDGFRGENTP